MVGLVAFGIVELEVIAIEFTFFVQGIATEPAAMMRGKVRARTFEAPAIAAGSTVLGGMARAQEARSNAPDEGLEGRERAADDGQIEL